MIRTLHYTQVFLFTGVLSSNLTWLSKSISVLQKSRLGVLISYYAFYNLQNKTLFLFKRSLLTHKS